MELGLGGPRVALSRASSLHTCTQALHALSATALAEAKAEGPRQSQPEDLQSYCRSEPSFFPQELLSGVRYGERTTVLLGLQDKDKGVQHSDVSQVHGSV